MYQETLDFLRSFVFGECLTFQIIAAKIIRRQPSFFYSHIVSSLLSEIFYPNKHKRHTFLLAVFAILMAHTLTQVQL